MRAARRHQSRSPARDARGRLARASTSPSPFSLATTTMPRSASPPARTMRIASRAKPSRERRPRGRVGRRRHRQRRGLGRGGHRHSVRDHSRRIRQRPGARSVDSVRSGRRVHDRGDRQGRARSMPAICTARCFSTSPASASTRASRRGSPPRPSPRADRLRVRDRRRAASVRAGRYSIRNVYDVDGKALDRRHHRSAGAVHRARQLAAVRQRRADRARARCSTTA